MKRFFVLFILLNCFIMLGVVYATDINIEDVKANIYLKPEDTHPNGVNMEIGTASFWFEVGAEVSGDSGESVFYQWYESKTGNMDDIVAVESENREIFIPEQKIGTTYYCVGVTTKLENESTTEYTKLLEATFTPKMIDKIWITNVNEPSIGNQPSMSAEQYTDYDLNDYYGYEITSVKWTPNDDTFKEGVEYKVDINIEFWENVKFSDKVDAKINGMEAEFIQAETQDSATVSYTFKSLENNNDENNDEQENQEENTKDNSGENNLNNKTVDESSVESEKLDMSSVILSAFFVVIIVFALMTMMKKK